MAAMAAAMAARVARAARVAAEQAGGWSLPLYSPRGEALWRRGRVARREDRPEIAGPVPIVVAGRGCAGCDVIKMPSRDPTTAIITVAVWVPVEPEGSAVRFVVRSPGGGGALHDVGESYRAA
eukprot:scaffold13189_cov64-Phaeocystis_antarctica.AAC.3